MSDEAGDTAGRTDEPAWPSAPGEVPAAATPPASTPMEPPTATTPTSEPAGWAPVPPPPGRKSRAGIVVGVILGAVVIVAGIVVGIVVLSGGDSFPDDDQRALIRAIPGSVTADDCTALSTGDNAVIAAVRCRVGNGAEIVTARQFAGVGDTNDGFEVDQDAVELSDSSTSDCIDRDKVEHDYDSNDGYSGRVLCYRKGGRSVIVWTNPDAGVVFTARRNDTRDVKLYEWWSAGISRRYPTTEEVDALKALAPESAEECQSARPLRGSIAAIRCDGVGDVSLYFTQYASTQEMADQYVSFLDDTGLEQGENAGTNTCPLEGAINVQGATTGRVFCTYDGSGEAPRIVFTDEATDVLVEVLGDDGEDGDALLVQWGVGSYDPVS
ncbi:MAG: hypothetical protein ACXW2Y_10890 [Acidimicrobiia bacterium]